MSNKHRLFQKIVGNKNFCKRIQENYFRKIKKGKDETDNLFDLYLFKDKFISEIIFLLLVLTNSSFDEIDNILFRYKTNKFFFANILSLFSCKLSCILISYFVPPICFYFFILNYL